MSLADVESVCGHCNTSGLAWCIGQLLQSSVKTKANAMIILSTTTLADVESGCGHW